MDAELNRTLIETFKHKYNVNILMNEIVEELQCRGVTHDDSKLNDPEAKIFAEYTPKLKGSTYGSEEYKGYLKEMGAALEHHYQCNAHHPEHFENGIRDMTLLDLVEMICDWKAASFRHDNGNIKESIKINQKRFGFSDDLRKILENTVELFVYSENNFMK